MDAGTPDEVGADTKECPRCAETVKAKAAICRFCNHEFNHIPSGLEEKVYLSEPVRVTSEKVVPATGESPIRLRDITHVKAHYFNKMGIRITGIIAVIVGVWCAVAEVKVWFAYTSTLVPFGVAAIYKTLGAAESWVVYSTPAGKFMSIGRDAGDADRIKAAVDRAIAENT